MDKNQYYYKGIDLGAVCKEEEATFKVWSPFAKNVLINLYKEGKGCRSYRQQQLKRAENGVWEISFPENLHGVYYDYTIEHENKTLRTADPYARACGINGERSMVVDRKATDPEGWEKDHAPQKESEDIIYEVHVKEFSWHKSGGFPQEYRGKYKAFTCENTVVPGEGGYPTGIRYLKELGVTHVQLMPVFDYGSVDEENDTEFNWGYDPVNYNVPEGSYATDPARGEVRIRELKELVQSLHSHGFRVIMDVVYNHTYREDSWLERTVPGYYYRKNNDGTLANGSGCGNDVASERPMCGKYILDSVLYWAEEYHMDGFRFDLMGLLDVELMNRIQRTLDERFGKGEKLIYGEPWAADDSPMEGKAVPALKKNIGLLDSGIGVFCDRTRDAVKGHVFKETRPGFVNGGEGLEDKILNGVGAWCEGAEGFSPKAPSQILSYVSAHDNLTLFDKLKVSMEPDGNYNTVSEQIKKAYKLAAAIYFTCQGRLFMLSGEEYARTKQGDENSYNGSIEDNSLDWNRAYENRDLVAYYKDLIRLRKVCPGLYDKSENAGVHIFRKRTEGKGCVSFCVNNGDRNKEDSGDIMFVAYYAGHTPKRLSLPEGEWELILRDGKFYDGKSAKEAMAGEVVMRPVSALILRKKQD